MKNKKVIDTVKKFFLLATENHKRLPRKQKKIFKKGYYKILLKLNTSKPNRNVAFISVYPYVGALTNIKYLVKNMRDKKEAFRLKFNS